MLTERAFQDVVEQYLDMVYRIALNWFRNPSDAEDASQNAMLRLWQTDTEFQGEDHLRHWLVRVTLNECKRISSHPWRSRKESEERPKPETIDEKWVLPFTLAPTKNVEALTMEKATVPVNYYKFGDGTKKESGCYTEIENLRITPTGYSFQSTPGEEGQMARFMVILKLKNGVEVDGRPTPVQPNDKEFKGVWELPVNLSDVDSVRFCLDDVWLFFNQEEAE